MKVMNNGAHIHCTPVNHLFHPRGGIVISPSEEIGRTTSEDASGSDEMIVVGEDGPEGSLISPSASDVSLSTTGRVMVRQNTAGIAMTARIFWNQDFDPKSRSVGNNVW
jgi:hypothetical protein